MEPIKEVLCIEVLKPQAKRNAFKMTGNDIPYSDIESDREQIHCLLRTALKYKNALTKKEAIKIWALKKTFEKDNKDDYIMNY